MKIGSLCSGYGGLDMAVEAYFNAKTVWMCDNDKYASIVIKERWGLPNLGNLKEVDWTTVEPIDILTAGYPCQPFSNAGLRKGLNDERHIWPSIKEIISQLRPNIVILENVRGHLTIGFKEVLQDLTEIGYDAQWAIVRASDVGAPHRRERLFVLAQPSNTNSQRSIIRGQEKAGNQRESQSKLVGSSKTIADTDNAGRIWHSSKSQRRLDPLTTSNPNRNQQQGDRPAQRLGGRFNTQSEMRLQRTPNPLDLNNKLNPKFVEYMMGLPAGWLTDLDISRSQQLKLLGNGVVPQQAYEAIRRLMSIVKDIYPVWRDIDDHMDRPDGVDLP
jgi:DNA (cytosine-5)-methyltransferase 1